MDITKIVGIAFVSIIVISMIKQHRPEFATYASVIAGCIILFLTINELTPIISMLQSLSDKMGVSSKFFAILLKITGIAYLTEFGTNICKDSGETAVASKVELAGKILIISLSIPILTTLMETLLGLIWGEVLKKFFCFVLLIILIFSFNIVFATNDFDIESFMNEVKGYSNDIFPELSNENWLNSILKRWYKA